jgi:hypothetical protein
LIAQIEQRRELGIGFSHDVASSATIAAIRRAAPNKLFSTKANTAAPAVSGNDMDLGFIDEFHLTTEFRIQKSASIALCSQPFANSYHPLLSGKKKAPKGAFRRARS